MKTYVLTDVFWSRGKLRVKIKRGKTTRQKSVKHGTPAWVETWREGSHEDKELLAGIIGAAVGRKLRVPYYDGNGLFDFLDEGNVIPYTPNSKGMDEMVNEIESAWYGKIQNR